MAKDSQDSFGLVQVGPSDGEPDPHITHRTPHSGPLDLGSVLDVDQSRSGEEVVDGLAQSSVGVLEHVGLA